MSRGVILFVENVAAFLKTRKDALEQEGYEVLTAAKPGDAKIILANCRVHLVIIDLRLRDDGDKDDFSGLELAKETDPTIPKIFLTAFPDPEAIRRGMLQDAKGRQPILDVVSKQSGPANMIEVVNRIFEQHVRIDVNLVVEWPLAERLSAMVHIEPASDAGDAAIVLDRAVEFEDLFRRLFYGRELIQVGRVLWERGGRVALPVYARQEGPHYDSQLVVCGRREAMARESDGLKKLSPKSPGQAGPLPAGHVHTAHFEAHSYDLIGFDWDDAESLESVYRRRPERTFINALANLDSALGLWRSAAHESLEGKALASLFRTRLGIGDDRLTGAALEAQVGSLVCQLPSNELSISCVGGKIRGHFDGRPFNYTNPALMLEADLSPWQPVFQNVTPGRLTGANVLADRGGRVWLTDFADAGTAPLAWNYVELESLIRFDWVERASLQSIHLMEQRLMSGDFVNFRTDDVEMPLRKTLKAIHHIRGMASRALGEDLDSYRVGLLFEALSRLAGFDADRSLRRAELMRRGHALLSAAIISERIVQRAKEEPKVRHSSEVGLRIDESAETVWVDGEQLNDLPKQSYALLFHLYQQPEHTCTQRELIKEVLGLEYVEGDKTQVGRLDSAIFRLRRGLGRDGGRYVLNVKRGRYRLMLNPKD
jgi:DNA-binding response OmpR family regulator